MNTDVRLYDVLRARKNVYRHLRPSPLYRYPALDRATGSQLWIKHENHLPTGAFKVRGGLNLLASLNEAERRAGVVAASTGNHGLSVAFAAQRYRTRAVIFVPEGANPTKVAAIELLGAQVIAKGRHYDEARVAAEAASAEGGRRYIHSGNEPLLIAGVGTYALEILEENPEIEAIVVPVGGGSGAAGTAVAVKSLAPHIEVIGVQSEAAPAAYLSWKERRPVDTLPRTFAEGLATGSSFELPQQILRELLDDFVLVSEQALRVAIRLYLEHTHNLAEGAGAAALAAVLSNPDRFARRRVAVVLSGGNLSPAQLEEVLPATRHSIPGSAYPGP